MMHLHILEEKKIIYKDLLRVVTSADNEDIIVMPIWQKEPTVHVIVQFVVIHPFVKARATKE